VQELQCAAKQVEFKSSHAITTRVRERPHETRDAARRERL